MLIRDFILIARQEPSIVDDQSFLIRIIPKWTFATVTTAHKTCFLESLLNTTVILAKVDKI